MTERERFESEINRLFGNMYNFSKFATGGYKNAGPHIMWEAWQAAKKAADNREKKLVEVIEYCNFALVNMTPDEIHKARQMAVEAIIDNAPISDEGE